MFLLRFLWVFICMIALSFDPSASLAASATQQKQSGSMSKVKAPSSSISPKQKVVVSPPIRIDRSGSQGVVAPGKPNQRVVVPMPKVVAPVPDADAPSRVNTGRPDPLGTTRTSGQLSYKYVCQARREWCYVNASTPIPADTICYCGDFEGATVVKK